MMTRTMKIRRHVRSARVSALTSEECREALLAAERANAEPGGSPLSAAHGPSPEARAGNP
jgi:hypothetical protein